MSVLGTVASYVGSQALDIGTSALKNFINTGINYHYTKKLQEDSQAFNAAEAQLSRDFSERMSNTSYQRALADLNAAGLNANLLMSNGGASSPSSASASSGIGGVPGADSSTLVPQYLEYKYNSALQKERSQLENDSLKFKIAETKKLLKYNEKLHYKDFPDVLKFMKNLS